MTISAGGTHSLMHSVQNTDVWMTGFGNFMYFRKTNDFRFLRVLQIVFRLNFLVATVALALQRPYMLYYICPLHTFFFLFVWVVMRIQCSQNKNDAFVLKKLGVALLILIMVFEIRPVFNIVFAPLQPLLLFNGSMHEWYFRSRLDCYATWFGMLCGLYYDRAATMLANFEEESNLNNDKSSHLEQNIIRASITTLSVFVLCLYGFVCLSLDKYTFNAIHRFTSLLPILAFWVCRSIHPYLRQHRIALFRFLGTITLETYILQHHLYLTDNAKMVIAYINAQTYPLLNFALATLVFVLASYIVFHATSLLNGWLFQKQFSLKQTFQYRILPIVAITAAALILITI